MLDTNVVGALGAVEALLPLLKKSSAACIVFVSSSMGSIAHAADPDSPYYGPRATEYRVSKAALNMLMTMYGARLKPGGVLVFGAYPGMRADPGSLKAMGCC